MDTNQTTNDTTNTPSIIKPMKPAVKRSDGDSRISPQLIVMIVLCGVAIFAAIRFLGSYDGSDPFASAPVLAEESPTDLPIRVITQTVEVTAVPAIFEEFTPAPLEPVIIVVTATPTPIPPTPAIEYVYVPVETIVERVVTQTVTIELQPSPTPVLPPGALKVCVYVEGATGLYINGVGVPGNRCWDYPTFRLVEDISIRVTK